MKTKIGRLNGSDFLVIPSMDNLKSRTQIISMVEMNKEQKFIEMLATRRVYDPLTPIKLKTKGANKLKKTSVLIVCVLAITNQAFANRFTPREGLFEKSPDFQIVDVSKDFKNYEEGELDYNEKDEDPEHLGKIIGTESRGMVFRTNDYIPKKLQGIVTEEDHQWIINWWKTNANPIEEPIVQMVGITIYINDPSLDVPEKLNLFYHDFKLRINNDTVNWMFFINNIANTEESYCLFDDHESIRIEKSYFTGRFNPEGEWWLPSV